MPTPAQPAPSQAPHVRVPEKKVVLGGSILPTTPAPPAIIELREADERAPAEMPGNAPTRPVQTPLYDAAAESTAEVARLDRQQAATELVEMLRDQVQKTRERARLGRLHYEWARLLELPLGDISGALEHYKKAHQFAPDLEPTVAGLRRVLLARGDSEAALPWFDEQARLTPSAEGKAILLYDKGLLLEGPLARPAEARKALEQAHELAPHDPSILRALSRARRRDQAWADLDRALEGQALGSQEDPALSAARFAERARLAEVKRRDVETAATFFQSAFERAPEVTVALADLERLYAGGQRAHELARALEERERLAQDPEVKAAILQRLARVFVDKLADLSGGAGALERAFAQTPQHLPILHELGRLYERGSDWTALASAWLRLEERSASKSEKLELRVRLGRLHEETLGEPEKAVAFYEGARKLDPTHPATTEALERLYKGARAWDALVGVYLGRAGATLDVGRRAEMHFQIGQVHEFERGQKEAALEEYKRSLGLVPGYPPAFRALVRLLAEAARHPELIEHYERAVELAEDDANAFVWLFKIGRVYEDALALPARAVEAYQRILARAPAHLDALLAVERAAERAGNHAVLVQALEAEAALASGARKLSLLQRAGDVAADKLGEEARALALYKAVLAVEPRFAPVLGSLRRLFERGGRFVELIEIYEKELALASEPAARATILYSIARLYERRLAQEEPAIVHYKKALEQDPTHEPSSQALLETLTRSERFEELSRQLAREVERRKTPEEKAEWATRLGEVYENRLKKPAEALKAYENALSAAPRLRTALEGRVRILASMGNHRALAAALDDDAEHTTDASVRQAARLRAAEVLRDDLGQFEEAARRYELVLGEHVGHAEALVALEQLYGELGQTENLERILGQEVNAFRVVGDQVASLRELLRVAPQGVLGSEALNGILTRAPGDRRALEVAERAAFAAGSADALAAVDVVLADDSRAPAVAAAHATRLGEHLEATEPYKALRSFKKALSVDPENFAATRGISRIASGAADAALLLEAAEGEARVTQDSSRAAQLFVRAAAVQKQKGDVIAAALSLERALDVQPEEFTAARELHGLLTQSGEHDRLVTALSSAAQRAQSIEARTSHWIAVARTHAHDRQDLPAALTALLRVEKAEPEHAPTLLELGELYMKDRQFEQAAARFEKAARGQLKPAQGLGLRLRLAALYQEHLGRPNEAHRILRQILDTEPRHREALRRYLALQMSQGDRGAAETAQAWVEASQGAERAEALTTLGRLNRDRGRVAEARSALEQAIGLVGMGEPGAGADLRQLLSEAGLGAAGWEGYVRALEGFTAGTSDAGRAAPAYLELGRVYLDELGDTARGFPALEKGLQALPEAASLRIEYASRLMSARLYERALGELRKLLGLEPARPETWRDLVQVFDALGRNAEAHLAQGPLVLSGGGNDLVRSTWLGRKPRPALVADDAFDATTLSLLASNVSEEAVGFVSQLSELGSKLFGPGLERFGLTSRDRMGARSNHPLRPVFDRVLRAFGVVELDLYPAAEYDGALVLVLTDPLGLVVPRSFAGLSEVDQVFALARFVVNVARGVHLIDVLSDVELSDLVVAGARLVEPRFAPNRSSGADLDALGRRISKALPWLAKSRFEDAARRFVASRPPDGASLGRELRAAALRAALIAADDVSPLLLLQRTRGTIVGLDVEESKSAQLDLLRTWVSEASMQVRKRAGLL